jgi:hypothetical protein
MKSRYISLLALIIAPNAYALDYSLDNWNFKLDADGMVGLLEPKDKKTMFIDDWDVKAQAFYNFNRTQRFGAVYSIDADCVEDDEYIHDAFILFEDRTVGRAELGLTHSIARKMGLGLPDVGYLRINNKSILHKELKLDKVLISDTTATTGHESLRLNLATKSTEYGQYGLSVSGLTDDYHYAIDWAVKIKQSTGKTKAAYSLALSYMDSPEDYSENNYSPSTTADWRAQMALGINLQYNSFIWGTSLRMIYDHNPTFKSADGLIAGSGISYDLLQSSVSLNYLFSDTKVWNHKDYRGKKLDDGDYIHTVLASFRYKYTERTSLFMSAGLTDSTPFFAVGLKSGF